MSDHSAIEWTDATWNPTKGCTKISPGCAHCYIERTPAFRIHGLKFVNGHIPLQFHEDRLEQPLQWKKPRRVFVNSLSDLFHRDVPTSFLHQVYHTMEAAHWHQFQVLTKRPRRLVRYLSWRYGGSRIPSRHIWHGVSVENQRAADERIPLLLQARCSVRFISAEPLLEEIDLTPYLHGDTLAAPGPGGFRKGPRLDWVIVGGESGPKSRQFDLAWARSIVAQCQDAGVSVFVKQLGAEPVGNFEGERNAPYPKGRMWDLRDKKGGDLTEWPEDLRVREYPRATGNCPPPGGVSET
jgi:protein gp37